MTHDAAALLLQRILQSAPAGQTAMAGGTTQEQYVAGIADQCSKHQCSSCPMEASEGPHISPFYASPHLNLELLADARVCGNAHRNVHETAAGGEWS